MSNRASSGRYRPHRLRQVRRTAALVLSCAALALLAGGSSPARADTPPTASALTVATALAPAVSTPVVSTPAVSAPACQPGLGIGLVDTTPGTDPRARTYVVAHVHPGATFSRRFQVCNGTPGPLAVALYPAAATIAGGAFTVPVGRTGNDLSSWITIDQPQVTLAAGQRLIATATFHVPSHAVAGERYAALLAELPPTPGNGGALVVDRTGLRVYLDVGPGGDPASDFTVDSLQATRDNHGVAHVLARVRNTGARALDLRGALQLTGGPGSQSAGPFPARLGTTIAPHTSEPVDITLSAAIRGGPWTAKLTLTSGELTRQASGPLSFPEASNTSAGAVPTVATPTPRTPTSPHRSWLIGFALALLLLVLALLAWLRRRRRDGPPSVPPVPLPVRSTQTAST